MFETIGNLLMIALWAAAIFFFGGGIILCICDFTEGSGGKIAKGVIAIILGIITFVTVYSWLDSIVWCLIFSGMVIGYVANFGDDEVQPAPQKERKYGFTDALVDTYCEYELTKAAVKDAIEESRK